MTTTDARRPRMKVDTGFFEVRVGEKTEPTQANCYESDSQHRRRKSSYTVYVVPNRHPMFLSLATMITKRPMPVHWILINDSFTCRRRQAGGIGPVHGAVGDRIRLTVDFCIAAVVEKRGRSCPTSIEVLSKCRAQGLQQVVGEGRVWTE